MPKLPECAHCLLNAHNPYLVCTLRPFRPNDYSRLDFRPDPNAKAEELWQPEGTWFIDGELVIKREPFYQ